MKTSDLSGKKHYFRKLISCTINLTSSQIVYFSNEIGGDRTNVTFRDDIMSSLRVRTMSQRCMKQPQGSAPSRHTIEAMTE